MPTISASPGSVVPCRLDGRRAWRAHAGMIPRRLEEDGRGARPVDPDMCPAPEGTDAGRARLAAYDNKKGPHMRPLFYLLFIINLSLPI